MSEIDELFKSLSQIQQNALNSVNIQEVKNTSDMTEEEIEQFHESEDYKNYSINSDNLQNMEKININSSGKSVQEIFGLSGERVNRFSYNCIDFLEVDHDDYMEIVDSSTEMQDVIAEGEKLLPTFKYLYEDIFMSLYQHDAEILPPDKMHIQSYMNRNILCKIVNTPAYISLRKACCCDLFNAGVGTQIIGAIALDILKEEVQKIEDFNRKKEALEKLIEQEEQTDYLSEKLEEQEELLEEMEMLGETDTEEYRELQESYEENQLSLQEARQLAEQLSKDCEELVETPEELVDTVSGVVKEVIDTATSEVQQVSEYVQAWGLGSGNDLKVPFGVKRSVLERIRNSSYLTKFTDLIGKYKECAIAEQKKKDKSSAIEIKSVKMGNKIENALPSEKVKLCNEVTKKDFHRRMTENQLVTYDKESQKDKNKGPIIICIDQSGSMSGDKSMWAKALAVGILEIAQRQKREFACIPYDSSVRRVTIIHKDEISPEKIIDIAEMSASGGTDFERPLRKASELIKESEFKEADVVFITDGDCCISDSFRREFQQLKEDREFRTFGVVVDQGHCYEGTLKDFCDNITSISNIADARNASSDVNRMIFSSL